MKHIERHGNITIESSGRTYSVYVSGNFIGSAQNEKQLDALFDYAARLDQQNKFATDTVTNKKTGAV